MSESYPNKEVAWHSQRVLPEINRGDIEQRIGATTEQVSALPGGLANDLIKIGSDRVLRIYRRDQSALPKELALLNAPWQHFKTPKVYSSGPDYIAMEFVLCRGLSANMTQGFATGRALAEIHARAFTESGFFAGELKVSQPLPDFPRALMDHMQTSLGKKTELDTTIKQAMAYCEQNLKMMQEYAKHPVLLHGDFKASNLHWTETEQLLVLDWEFAFAGPKLMDIGQLARWGMPEEFKEGFVEGYRAGGGDLEDSWLEDAAVFDLVNLVDLMTRAPAGSITESDCYAQILNITSQTSS